MTKIQISLLALALVGIGAFWMFVHLSEIEPEVIPTALVCPDCGQPLTQKDAPCMRCQVKKKREQIEAGVRESSVKREPHNASNIVVKVILATGISGVLLVFAYWPQIRSRLHPEKETVEFLIFYCPHCGRKLRFNAVKAGMQGKCPGCKESCTFPEAEPEPTN